MIWIWLGIIIILTLLELSTNKLIAICLVASGIVSLILSIFIDSFLIQFLVFIILGTIFLSTTRDYLLKLAKDKKNIVKRGKNEK